MAQNNAGQSTDEEALKDIFDQAMNWFDGIEKGKEPTNSDAVQLNIKSTILQFEKATNLVSLSGMFSKNENLEELPTETLQYMLLPALLGTLSLKLCNQPRKEVINVAEIYFRDFIQRCNDYGVTDIEVPQPSSGQSDSAIARPSSEQSKIANMVLSREAKIKRYKQEKELKDKISTLAKAMESPNSDDSTKREYFITVLLSYVNQAIDELASIEQEKPILEYMAKHAGEPRPKEKPRTPLKPIIITKDAVQKAVFGIGYPAIPAMTVEEFYDRRVKEGLFPAPNASNIPHAKLEVADEGTDETEQIIKERLVEDEDPEELARQRSMDEYKDEHRRGSGNRYNRS